MFLRTNGFLFLSAILLLAGCKNERSVDESALKEMAGVDELKETVPVSGVVSINGTPTAGVNIYAYTEGSGGKAAAETRTVADGKFSFATYKPGDGLPPGEYKLAFAHIPKPGKGKKPGEDLLDGKYRNPMKNDAAFTLTVKNGEPQKELKFDLK